MNYIPLVSATIGHGSDVLRKIAREHPQMVKCLSADTLIGKDGTVIFTVTPSTLYRLDGLRPHRCLLAPWYNSYVLYEVAKRMRGSSSEIYAIQKSV